MHNDDRGWVANPLIIAGIAEELRHLHVVSLNPGTVRGNHRHQTYREWLFVFGGEYDFYWNTGNEIMKKSVGETENYTIEIPPGINHAIKNVSQKVIYLTAYQDADMKRISLDTFPADFPELK